MAFDAYLNLPQGRTDAIFLQACQYVPLAKAILLAVPEALKFLSIPDTVAAPMRQILYGGLLIAFMFLRPEGILGSPHRKKPSAAIQ